MKPPLFWSCIAACIIVLCRNLRSSSGRSYAFAAFSLIVPIVVLSAVFIVLLQGRYEFLAFLFGYLFMGCKPGGGISDDSVRQDYYHRKMLFDMHVNRAYYYII